MKNPYVNEYYVIKRSGSRLLAVKERFFKYEEAKKAARGIHIVTNRSWLERQGGPLNADLPDKIPVIKK